MPINGRAKGAVGEREWAAYLRDRYGCSRARRAAQNGVTGGRDVENGIPATNAEVKRVERLNLAAAMTQAIVDSEPGEVAYVAHRRNRGEWLVTLRAEDLMRMAERLASIEGKPIYPAGS